MFRRHIKDKRKNAMNSLTAFAASTDVQNCGMPKGVPAIMHQRSDFEVELCGAPLWGLGARFFQAVNFPRQAWNWDKVGHHQKRFRMPPFHCQHKSLECLSFRYSLSPDTLGPKQEKRARYGAPKASYDHFRPSTLKCTGMSCITRMPNEKLQFDWSPPPRESGIHRDDDQN